LNGSGQGSHTPRLGGLATQAIGHLAVEGRLLFPLISYPPTLCEVVSGHSFVDQARITGESMPIEKVAGTTVYAGSINASGVLEVRAERIGRDTSYGRIIEAVERAERSRAPVQRLADRLAAYLVYLARGAALPVRAGSPPAHRSPFSAASAARRGSARSVRAA